MRNKSLGKGTVILLVVAMIFALSAVNFSTAQELPGSDDKAFSSANEKVDVLIGFYKTPGPSERALIRAHGGEIYRQFNIVDVIAASMAQQAAEALTQNPSVRYVEPDHIIYALNTVAVQSTEEKTMDTSPWGIERIFGDEEYSFPTWDTSTGSGIAVAILDSGISEHIDLDIVGGYNAFEEVEGDYEDVYGHGTHVAGTVAALDNDLVVKPDDNNKGVVGVSPDADLYAVKVLDDDGVGPASIIVTGIEWAIEKGIPIMNMSLGTRHHNQTLQDTCDAAYEEGHILVAAAGNSGNRGGGGDNVIYPAKYDSVIAVAASDSDDNRATWSSTGSDVELIAPGVSVLSTWKDDTSRLDPQPFCIEVEEECYYYKYGSGTSMSSPHVAGVAALAWAENPDLANVQIREILQDTAEDLGLSSNHQGYGLARADLAVRAVEDLEPPANGNIEGTVEDEDEAAIEGATVVVEGTDLSATTDADGDYLLEDVPTGNQDVTASADGYAPETVTVKVEEDATVTQDFTLGAISTYTVSGTVEDMEADTPLEGAKVTIEKTDQLATTDSEGNYEITDVEEGTYDITASKDGYSSETKTVTVDSDTSVNFALKEITAEGTVRVESITYSTRGGRGNDRHLDITVALEDDLGDPVADASVSATLSHDDGSSWNFSGTTASNGSVTFTLNNHGSGCYETEVTAVEAEGLEWDGETPENEYCK